MRRKAKGSEAVRDFLLQVHAHRCYRSRDACVRSPVPLGNWNRKHFLKISTFRTLIMWQSPMCLKCVFSNLCDHDEVGIIVLHLGEES